MGSGLKRKQEERGIEEDTGRVAVLCVLRAIEEGGAWAAALMVTGLEVVPKCVETYKGGTGEPSG